MRLLVTGGTGALGRAFLPLAAAAGHEVRAPGHAGLDLFDPAAVAAAVAGMDAVLHLATRIQALDTVRQPVQPTVTFVYPSGQPATEQTPVGDVPDILRSALAAEQQAAWFAAAGRRGVVLRLGLLDGPGTGKDQPNPAMGATLHTGDAGRALLAALGLPSGIYNVCRDGERVSNRKFAAAAAWRPRS